MIWNPINLIFYFFYKPNTRHFKQRSFAIYLGVLGALLLFNFLTAFSLLLINQLYEFQTSELDWTLEVSMISVSLIVILNIISKKRYDRIIDRFDNETPSQRTRRVLLTAGFGFLLVIVFYANLFQLIE
ncbi:hypothetical protein C7460_12724 [Marinoscillum furvescens DSM 4134]|uniref:Uncharacterized protein n=1 Tax=Marinoscillum furvescens DSM 4134 TaxID=1122208 RepID=A0A3D9KY12_MARFU|nr:hypothetical protein C7460_12724 [Marinoscillum furvescens DSM 4134]